MTEFKRDKSDWLFKLSPQEWIQAGLVELRRAEEAVSRGELPAAYAGLKRAAGMALNAGLISHPEKAWGRTYVEHLEALQEDTAAPTVVREAAAALTRLKAGPGSLLNLRSRASERRWVEAAKTVMAHGYALAHGAELPRGALAGEGEPGASEPSVQAGSEVIVARGASGDEASTSAGSAVSAERGASSDEVASAVGGGGLGPLKDSLADKEVP